MNRKRIKRKALIELKRIVYWRRLGIDTGVAERRLMALCAELASFGTLTAEWWYNLFMEA